MNFSNQCQESLPDFRLPSSVHIVVQHDCVYEWSEVHMEDVDIITDNIDTEIIVN